MLSDIGNERMTRRWFLGASAAAAGAHSLPGGQKGFPARILHNKGLSVQVNANGRPLFTYRYASAVPKPYVHPLFAPGSRPVTLDSPADHVHHRGLMLAWSAVNGFDFWVEHPPPPHGRIVHQRFETITEEPIPAFTAVNHWMAGGGTLLTERRRISSPFLDPAASWLEWESELQPVDQPVTLSAEGAEYNGLGMRFIRSMDQGRVLNANGTAAIPKANGEPARWCAYYAPAGGSRTCGAAIFDHPDNPRHPAPFFVMGEPFGYLSAAPTFYEPFALGRGERLILRYAIVAFLGAPDRARMEELYDKWTGRSV